MPEADIIENRREILLAPPGMRLWRGVSAIARTVSGTENLALHLMGPGWASMTHYIMFAHSIHSKQIVWLHQIRPRSNQVRGPLFLLPICRFSVCRYSNYFVVLIISSPILAGFKISSPILAVLMIISPILIVLMITSPILAV